MTNKILTKKILIDLSFTRYPAGLSYSRTMEIKVGYFPWRRFLARRFLWRLLAFFDCGKPSQLLLSKRAGNPQL